MLSSDPLARKQTLSIIYNQWQLKIPHRCPFFSLALQRALHILDFSFFQFGSLVLSGSYSVEFFILSEHSFPSGLPLGWNYLSSGFIRFSSFEIQYANLTLLGASFSKYHRSKDKIITFSKVPLTFISFMLCHWIFPGYQFIFSRYLAFPICLKN